MELLGQANRRHKIVSAMTVKMDSAFTLEHFDQRLQSQIDVRLRHTLALGLGLAIVLPGALILACLGELLALQSSDFHTRGRSHLAPLEVPAFGIFSISHLQTA